MKWIDALKYWNELQGGKKWCIPKKGSKDYDTVRSIMAGKTTGSDLNRLVIHNLESEPGVDSARVRAVLAVLDEDDDDEL